MVESQCLKNGTEAGREREGAGREGKGPGGVKEEGAARVSEEEERRRGVVEGEVQENLRKVEERGEREGREGEGRRTGRRRGRKMEKDR